MTATSKPFGELRVGVRILFTRQAGAFRSLFEWAISKRLSIVKNASIYENATA